MLREILYKWFGVEPSACLVCEVLRESLASSEKERRELLQRVLAPSTPEPVLDKQEDLIPLQPSHIPWRVRQQMLEQEDRKKAELLKNKAKEIEELEKELEIHA